MDSKTLREMTQTEIWQYWVDNIAPKYGYRKLIRPIDGKVLIDLDNGIAPDGVNLSR